MSLFHSHDHAHHHSHGHEHDHGPRNYNRIFALGVGLNIAFVIVEASFGILADSLALLADAGHNLSDVLALLIAWGASWLAQSKPSNRRTYGLKRSTILASLISTTLLLVALGAIAWEAINRLFQPQSTNGWMVIGVAAVGVFINGITAYLFMADRKKDLNIRAAYLHMAADAAISLGVVIAGLLLLVTGWLWLDPVLSLGIAVIIFIGSWSLLRDSLDLSIDAVPKSVDLSAVRMYLESLPEVEEIHDLHVWALSTTETALTVHLISRKTETDNLWLYSIQRYLHDHFEIAHATLQVENPTQENPCLLYGSHCG